MKSLDAAAENNEPQPGDTFIQAKPPHEAIYLVLSYLHVFELLCMSESCRSMRDAIDKDILPWLHLVFEKPLNSRLSDYILMKITSKANGQLRTLALINCEKITDDGLQTVVANNPRINKLYVPRCTSLSPEGVITAVKLLAKDGRNQICLQVNGIYNIEKEHLETLCSLIQVNQTQQLQRNARRNFYHGKDKHFLAIKQEEESTPSIDIDICPKCNEVRMVFNCLRETCKTKREQQLSDCRACYLCIPRCEECGRCVDSEELSDSEAACTDILCSDCWLQLPKCNFCNKPYCNQHIDQQCSLPGSSGFVCVNCHTRFIET